MIFFLKFLFFEPKLDYLSFSKPQHDHLKSNYTMKKYLNENIKKEIRKNYLTKIKRLINLIQKNKNEKY